MKSLNIDQIAMCCLLIDTLHRALQTNKKNSTLKLVFEILAENRKFWSKTEKYSKE